MTSAALCEIAPCLALCSLLAAFWRRQLYSGSTRLGETNGDRLLWRAGTVFAFPNVFHFLAHKLACLSGRRFAFTLILARAFDWFFFWHNKMISPLITRLDVINNDRYSRLRNRQSAFTCAAALQSNPRFQRRKRPTFASLSDF